METPAHSHKAEEIDEETKTILTERLKTIDEDAKAARPWVEVRAELREKLKHPAPE
ncbi:MAG: hypothetical protein WA324_19370 [Bryobacteraceae bacterium]